MFIRETTVDPLATQGLKCTSPLIQKKFLKILLTFRERNGGRKGEKIEK